MHTWSLAVEEQFYIVFPPLLYLLFRYASRFILPFLIVLSLISFALCVALTIRHQPTAFYLLPFRAWELGIGALLALSLARRPLPYRGRSWPAFIGLLLILIACFALTKETLFPGWVALVPCAGAALIIGWGQNGLVGRFLSWAPIVWIGKISYSFYLWHWPIIVFWKLQTGPDLSILEAVCLFSAAMVLAWISTALIEAPFRSGKIRSVAAPKTVYTGGAVLLGFALLGALIARDLLVLRTPPPAVMALAQVADYTEGSDYTVQFRKGTCMIGQSEISFSAYDKATCAAYDPDRTNVLLIGDSHAAHYWHALQDRFPLANIIQATASGCRPLIEADGATRCTDMRTWFFDTWLDQNRPDAIILAGRWSEDEMPYVGPTLSRLAEKTDRIGLIGPIVEYDADLPLLLARAEWQFKELDGTEFRTAGKTALDADMRVATETAGATYISVLKTLCPEPDGTCKTKTAQGAPIQFDYGHLTLRGASELIADMQAQFAPLLMGSADP